MTEWTKEQHEKFRATWALKKAAAEAAKRGTEAEAIPLDAIPERAARRERAPRVNGTVQLHAEVDQRSGELCLVIGRLRVPLRLR